MRSRRGDVCRVARLGKRRLGVVRRHSVETRPERGDRLALVLRREVEGCREGVLNERVLLYRRPDDAGCDLHRSDEVGRPGEHLVGRPVLLIGVHAPVTRPGPRLRSGDHDGAGAAGCHQRQGVVDHLLLGDADLAQQRVRAGRADASGDGASRVGERPRALGHRDAVDVPEERRRAGVGRSRRDGVGHQIHDRRRVGGGAEPHQDGEPRMEGAHGSGHDARCYGPAMAHGEAGRWESELEDFNKESFEADGKRRTVFRIGTGPAVLVISEIPGITPLVAQFGRRVAAAGCTAVLPVLFGDPGRPPGAAYMFQSIGPACVSREFSAFALKRTSPVTVWLRKLAAAEHERCGGPGVGVVGMCFTGGFALAMMVDDIVLAPVLSQPSLPFPLSKKFKADIGISDGDLARVKERTASGTCLLGLRFTDDPFCFEERFETLRRELGDAFIAVEIDSAPGNPHGHPNKAHSVLTEHLHDEEGTPTRAALDQTLTFFREKLGVGSGPGSRPTAMGS